MQAGELHAFDRRLLLALRHSADPGDPLGPSWVEEMVRDFTAFGSIGVLVLLTLLVAGFLVAQEKTRTALSLVLSVALGIALSFWLKDLFDRPRPALVPHASRVYTKSFPSGHAMLSAVTYLTLAATLARTFKKHQLRVYILQAGGLLALLVGVSRIYLGVHWPTDVLGGWCVGVVWAIAAWLLTLRLQEQGNIEPDPAQNAP